MYLRTVDHNRQVYDLRYDGRHALAALRLMEPFLVRKKTEAQTAFAFYAEASMGVHPRSSSYALEVWVIRERYFKKMKKLK